MQSSIRKVSFVGLAVVLMCAARDGASGADVYTHSVHPVVHNAKALAVDGSDNVLTVHDGHGLPLTVDVFKHDSTSFGTHLAKFSTPAPTNDPGGICYPYGLDVDPAGNIVIGMYGGTICTLSTITATGAPVSQHDVSGVGVWPSDIRNINNGGCDGDGNFWWLGWYGDPCHPSEWVSHSTLLDNSNGSQVMRIENNDHPPISYNWRMGGVDADANGLVYVADWTGVWRFDPGDIAGTAVRIAGEGPAGSGPGEFSGATSGLAVRNGKIYVADEGNDRIQIFDMSTGDFIQELAVDPSEYFGDLDVDSLGNIYLNSPGSVDYNIHKWTFFRDADSDGVGDHEDLCPTTDPCTVVAPDGCADADGDGVADMADLCPDTDPCVVIAPDGCPDGDGDGVGDPFDQCLNEDPNLSPTVGSGGCSMELAYTHYIFTGPHFNSSIAVDSNGDVLVASKGGGGPDPIPVKKYQGGINFKEIATFDVPAPKNPDDPNSVVPYGLDVDSEDNIVVYMAGGGKYTLATISATGVPIRQHDLTEIPNCRFENIAVDLDDNVWAVGMNLEDGIYVLHAELIDKDDGSVIMRVDNDDLAPAGLSWSWFPGSVTVDQSGLVYIDDYYRVIRFDPCDVGNTAVVIAGNADASSGSGPGEFSGPIHGLAVVGDRLYVADTGNQRVQIFKASTGQFIQELAHPSMQSVFDLDVDAQGNIYVNHTGTYEQVHMWAPPFCGDALHLPPTADVDKNCVVDRYDVVGMAEMWLDCTDPQGDDCQNLVQADVMYMPHCWTRTVDGLLSDWPADPCWVDLDLVYFSYHGGFPNDVTSARYTACWDPCEDLIYAAVEVVDTDHVFETAPLNWDTSDRVEIYVQADPNGGNDWGSSKSAQYDKAQQYIIGYQGIIQGWTWAVFGHGTYLPGDFEPFNAHFADAGRISGDTITYEISAKAWQWYGGITPAVDPNVVRQLEPGAQVGFDVVVDSRWGTLDPCDAVPTGFGMLSANPDKDKYQRAEQFQRWALLDYDGSIVPPVCGDWGYLAADVSGDCYVDLGDVGALASQWMDCTDPSCR